MVTEERERGEESPDRDAPSPSVPPQPYVSLQTPVREALLETRLLVAFLVELVHSNFRSEWSGTHPLGFLGCHLWHLLSLQKNKFKCNAPGF